LIESVMHRVPAHGAVVPAVAVSDTLKRVNQQQEVEDTVERRQLVMVQTPQGFERRLLEQAYQQAWQQQANATDDASLVEALGHPVFVVEGDSLNFKLTTPRDLMLARALLDITRTKEQAQ
jgi:2-C-methyl-D-erythritol 4-phosphate cytidylyltransferase